MGQYTLKFPVLILFLILIHFESKSQSISPATFNNGGGFSGGYEWSLGESVSIANFITNNLILTTGILQPLSNVVTSINEFGPSVFGNQIVVGPNPVLTTLNFKAQFTQIGQLSIQLLDTKSKIVFTKQVGTIWNQFQTAIPMENFVSGLYYIKVDYKLNNGSVQTGVYKIIKL
jgi:uncharacterized membrane protein YkvI